MENRVSVAFPTGEVLISTQKTLIPELVKALDFYLKSAKKRSEGVGSDLQDLVTRLKAWTD